MAALAADRNLLFGLLALQIGLINQGQLVAAFQAWTLDKARALADHLVGRGDLEADDRSAVEALVARHLKKYGGDAEKSLAALPAGPAARERLAAIGDPELTGVVAQLPAGRTAIDPEADADRTASLSVGPATSDGRRFRILRPHAQGGLGAVFVALDAELHREVALKQILDRHADDPSSRARFVLEAEVTGGLEHPGIVPVYGLGRYPDGRPYYAMRFVRGDTLKQDVDHFHADEALKKDPGRRSLKLRQRLRRFVDVCNAVAYAHSRGVLHRDLKPANVVVGRYGETLVVDWGLAKAMGHAEPGGDGAERTLMPSSSGGSSETLPGSALGTPAYMSPEQAEGQLDRLGPRSDVYSLGATLYYLLTGRPPFEGEAAEVIRGVQKGELRPPRQRDAAIDRALEAVCLKAMAHRPADRYPSPRALAEDVERWMADEPVSAWREPLSRRARRWAKRNRTAVTGAVVALVAGVIGLSAVLVVQTRAKADLAAANDELGRSRAAVQARYELAAEAIQTFHTGVLEDFLLKEETFKEVRDRLLKSAAAFYGKLGALLGRETDPASRRALAAANFELAELTAKVGRPEAALAAHRAALAVREALAAEPGTDAGVTAEVGRSLTAVAGLLEATGQTDEAVAAYRRSEALLAGPAGSDAAARAALADCRSRLGWFLSATGRTDEALASYRRARADQEALAAAAGASNDARRDLADTVHRIGKLLSDTGKPAEAETEYRTALALRRKLADENPAVADFLSSLADSHNELGVLLALTAKPAEAEAEIRTALALRRKLAEDHPAVTRFRHSLALSHNSLGNLFEDRGELAEAEAEQRKEMAIYQKLADENPAVTQFRRDLATGHVNFGYLCLMTGRPAEAEAEIRTGIALRQKLAEDHPAVTDFRRDVAGSHWLFGNLLAETGRPAAAEAELRMALALWRNLAEDDPKVPANRDGPASAQYHLSVVVRRLGRPPEARDLCERAVAVYEALSQEVPNWPWYRLGLAESYLNRGLARRALGDPAGATADARRALDLFKGLESLSNWVWYLRACCHAALAGLAGAGMPPGPAAAEADAAMALLHQAVAKGFRNAAAFRTEDALDPLRDRPDFRLLMMDLAFPAEPFAAAR